MSIGADGTIVVVGDGGAARIAPDGSAKMLVVDDVNAPYSEGVQVLPDGRALIAEGLNERVTRVWPDGHRQTVAGASRRGREVTARGVPALGAYVPAPTDVAVLPDGSFVIADDAAPEPRVMRVDAAGVIRTVAGGGHGWREGAPGTSVSLGAVWAGRREG